MSYFKAEPPECVTLDKASAIELDIIPRSIDLGGFKVSRVLPAPKKKMVGPFIFWDQAGPSDFLMGSGIDVRPHPHICLSTMTYLFKGRLEHRDSLGSHQIITPGDVNLMTAGAGIVHSERTPQVDREETNSIFGIQCWLALPFEKEEMEPNFNHYGQATLPRVSENGLAMTLVAGSFLGLSSPVMTQSRILFVDCRLAANERFSIPPTTEERAIYILSGSLTVNAAKFDQNVMLLLKPNITIELSANEKAHFIILGGDVLDGERYVWWNFVASSKDRIEQAKEDWENNRFSKVPGDDKEFIPLPGR